MRNYSELDFRNLYHLCFVNVSTVVSSKDCLAAVNTLNAVQMIRCIIENERSFEKWHLKFGHRVSLCLMTLPTATISNWQRKLSAYSCGSVQRTPDYETGSGLI